MATDSISVVVGLGNPGNKYAGTRHNIGFEVIDRLAEALSVRLGPGKGPFYAGDGRYRGVKVVLVKPTTYMNVSGDAVVSVLNWYKLDPEDCLVCFDDLNLAVGTLRLRPQGSAGGHNGMKDIIRKLGTDRFPRLRIGIGGDFPEDRQSDFVLSRFTSDERAKIDDILDRAAEAVLTYVAEDIDEAMNRFN
ncbi:MAG: aminoacyl-tRNA hydrolase [Balneolaceae bacterium]|nr:aminoacyl-tRNA hydrolase [Balneolaceae bacterium]